jgi:hypothetical protein
MPERHRRSNDRWERVVFTSPTREVDQTFAPIKLELNSGTVNHLNGFASFLRGASQLVSPSVAPSPVRRRPSEWSIGMSGEPAHRASLRRSGQQVVDAFSWSVARRRTSRRRRQPPTRSCPASRLRTSEAANPARRRQCHRDHPTFRAGRTPVGSPGREVEPGGGCECDRTLRGYDRRSDCVLPRRRWRLARVARQRQTRKPDSEPLVSLLCSS